MEHYIGYVMIELPLGAVPLYFVDLAHAERLIGIIHAMKDSKSWVAPGWLEVW